MVSVAALTVGSPQALIETLELAAATVTLDAMHCQKKTAKLIRKQNAHYVLCVKDNQKCRPIGRQINKTAVIR